MSESWIEDALRRWRESRQPEALGELLKSQRDRAYAVALRLTGAPAEAEDAVQDACLKLLTRTKGFEDRRSFEVTLYRAVVQCALDRMRARRRAEAREAVVRDEKVLLAAVESTAVDVAEQREVAAELRQAVAELPDEERVPILLCYGQGLSVAQAAETLEIPRETLRARLDKTLEGLRHRLKDRGRSVRRGALLLLLWQDGSEAAPSSLCESLDRVLPGRPCAQVPALAQPGPAAAAPVAATWGWAATVAGCVVLAGGVYLALARSPQTVKPEQTVPAAPGEPDRGAGVVLAGPASGGGRGTVAPTPPVGQLARTVDAESTHVEEGSDMNVKWLAPVVAGGVLFSGAAFAGDPNPDVAKAIEKIEARRAEKAEAQAKLQNSRETERRDGYKWGASAPAPNGGAPGGGQGVWGQGGR